MIARSASSPGCGYPDQVSLSGIEHLAAVAAMLAAVVVLLGVIIVTASVASMAGRVRRRWRVQRTTPHGATPWSLQWALTADRATIKAAASAGAANLASPRWWTVQVARRRMWQAVRGARHAVDVARRAGAPVGEFPTLARQLESSARSIDALARAKASTPGGVRRAVAQLHRVERAACDLHHAAVESLQSVVSDDVDPLLASVHQEITAVAAGTRAVNAIRRHAS